MAIVLIGAFVSAAGFALGACILVRKLNVLDAPDGERKLQAAPVPRLGGLGILAGSFAAFGLVEALYAISPGLPGSELFLLAPMTLWLVLAACAAFALIGLADDLVDLPATLKLALLIAVCLIAPLLGLRIDELDTPFGPVDAAPVLIAGSALWLLVFTNAANFMDGSNGLSMGAIAIMMAGLGASVALQEGTVLQAGFIIPAGAVAGFLTLNMKGKLYAGDVGAFGVSSLFGLFALVCGLPAWTIATLALPFLVDALLTLLSRARRGESLFTAHRDHTYQALLKAGWSHWDVAVFWWGLTATCAVAAAVGAAGGGALPFWLFWSFTLLLSLGWLLLRREAGEITARL